MKPPAERGAGQERDRKTRERDLLRELRELRGGRDASDSPMEDDRPASDPPAQTTRTRRPRQ